MNDSELFDRYVRMNLPTSFRVIGIGEATKEIIETVKSYGYDCVSATVLTEPFECVPTDEDKMVIIVARDNEELANTIAKTYHDAGVLTIGFVYNADSSCYDNIATDTNVGNIPEVIKHLLQPIVTQGLICYDFNDLRLTLRNFQFFKTLAVEGKNVEEAVNNMKKELEKIPAQHVESLSAHLYFNRERQPHITMADMKHLSDMISSLPESICVIWSVNFDETLPDDLIRITIIMSGKEL